VDATSCRISTANAVARPGLEHPADAQDHEGGTIASGLIHINYAYGWIAPSTSWLSRTKQRPAPIASTDRIIGRAAGLAGGDGVPGAYLIATWHDASVWASWPRASEAMTLLLEQAQAAEVLACGGCTRFAASKRELAAALRQPGRTRLAALDPEIPCGSQFEMYAPPGTG